MYKEVQHKINGITTQEPNPYAYRNLELNRAYITQLDKVVQAYPAYKAGIPNDYDHQLSMLNGITKKMGIIQKMEVLWFPRATHGPN